jgi:D-alanyl-D-alanine carboxypeptidase
VIEIFRSAGFEWGGDWQSASRDPMHFQFCSGY